MVVASEFEVILEALVVKSEVKTKEDVDVVEKIVDIVDDSVLVEREDEVGEDSIMVEKEAKSSGIEVLFESNVDGNIVVVFLSSEIEMIMEAVALVKFAGESIGMEYDTDKVVAIDSDVELENKNASEPKMVVEVVLVLSRVEFENEVTLAASEIEAVLKVVVS